jgi:alkylated DNA repair dioxygenase AlkB
VRARSFACACERVQFTAPLHEAHHNAMEAFFNTVPEKQKVRLVNGEVLHDTAVIPGFVARAEADAVWAALRALPVCDPAVPLTLDPENPRWVTGASAELNYRGKAVKRSKLWLQRDVTGARLYRYTGWQWAVTKGTYRLGAVPALESLVDGVDAKLGFRNAHNQWIATLYTDGADNIGLHSDKDGDWARGSAFAVVKLGAPRPFVFTQAVDGKDVEVFRAVLEPGTAVIVGMDANSKVKHGVPPVPECGPSGSIVGRCIATHVAWDQVRQRVARSASSKARARGKRGREEGARDQAGERQAGGGGRESPL